MGGALPERLLRRSAGDVDAGRLSRPLARGARSVGIGDESDDSRFLAERPADAAPTEFFSFEDFQTAKDHQSIRQFSHRSERQGSVAGTEFAGPSSESESESEAPSESEPPDLLAQINALAGGGGSVRSGHSLGNVGLQAVGSQQVVPAHVSQASIGAPSQASSHGSQQPQPLLPPQPLDFAALRTEANARQAALDRRREKQAQALTMHANGQESAAIARVVGGDARDVPAYLAQAKRRAPVSMNKKAMANSVFGVLAQDGSSAPTPGAGATAHAVGSGLMRGLELGGRGQDLGEVGTFIGQQAGSENAKAIADFSGNIGLPIGVGDASLSTLQQMANAAGQMGQAGTKAAINAYDDPLQVAMKERADASLAHATGHMDIKRIRARREQLKAQNGGVLPDDLPSSARFGPSVWRDTRARINAEAAKTKILQSHGFTPQRSFTQDETAAALGATVEATEDSQGRVERILAGQDSRQLPVHMATSGQRRRAMAGRRLQDVGEVMQGEDASEALRDGNFGQAAFRAAASAGHAVGNAAFGTGLSEVPVLGDITNLAYNVGTGLVGAGLEHGSKALFKNSHEAVKKQRLGELHNAFNHEYQEGDPGAGSADEIVTPQERRNRYGLDWRERGQASKSDIVPQRQLDPGQLTAAERGQVPASTHRVWQGKGRAGPYLGNTESLEGIQRGLLDPEAGRVATGTLPKISTGTGSDQESGWAPRKRSIWERMKRGISRWWGTTKLGRRFKRRR